MTPAARIAAVIDILEKFSVGRTSKISAAQALRFGIQHRRYIGASDRNAISNLYWQIQRHWSRLCWHLEAHKVDITSRHLVLAALVLINGQRDSLANLFSSDMPYGPAALNEVEKILVNELADQQFENEFMPKHVLLEWPEWLLLDATNSLGEDLENNLLALTMEAPTDVRINPIKLNSRRQLRDRFASRKIICHPTRMSPLGVRLNKRLRFEELQDWKNGLFEVQDEGSQLASLLCDAQPYMQVADICAGAGGKSLVMAAIMKNKGRVLALDTRASCIKRLGERMRRAGIHNIERKVVSENWCYQAWRGKFDRVVVDAPCSGSGTWRRKVDARRRLTSEQLASYQQTQANLLHKASAMVAPGGRIIYITCSILASEGVEQINKFLEKTPELDFADISDIWAHTIGVVGGGDCPPHDRGMLKLLPYQDDTDGFFISVLKARL